MEYSVIYLRRLEFSVVVGRNMLDLVVIYKTMRISGWSAAQEAGVGSVEEVTVDADLGASREASRTGNYSLPLLHTALSPAQPVFIAEHTIQ